MNTEILYFIRERNGLTQTEMGSILGVSKFLISKWEKGKDLIPLNRLNLLCHHFNISMDYVIGRKVKNKDLVYNKDLNKKVMGERLKIFRKNNNLTQVELANILHTTHSTISAYESGKTMLLTAFALQIVRDYNISLDWLCGRIN